MTIHYPTGSQSETSSFRFQREPPHQIRPSFAAGCCLFWRTRAEKRCIHPTVHQQQGIRTSLQNANRLWLHIFNRIAICKVTETAEIQLFKVLSPAGKGQGCRLLFCWIFSISALLLSNHYMLIYSQKAERKRDDPCVTGTSFSAQVQIDAFNTVTAQRARGCGSTA